MSIKHFTKDMQWVIGLRNVLFFLPYFLYCVFVRSTLGGHTPFQRVDLHNTAPGPALHEKSADSGCLVFSITH